MLEVRVLVGTQAVQVVDMPEQLRHVESQAAQTALPMSKSPVLQGQEFNVRVRVGSQEVQFIAVFWQVRQV